MSNAAKLTAGVGAGTAVLGVLLAALTYGASRATSSTQAAVMHESRHVRTESDVDRIDETVEDHFKIIQSQMAASHEMSILILQHVVKE